MQSKTKATITLFALSAILSELLSGSSPATHFFNPLFLVLQLLTYGIPALVMREMAVRWKLGISGIFILALGYGIFNEGLVARTFFSQDGTLFSDGYGFYYGLNFPWIGFAAVWHSLHAILFPILLTYFLYPETANQPWIASNRKIKILFALAALESIVIYFTPKGAFPTSLFFIFWLAIFAFAWLSKKFTAPIKLYAQNFSKKPFFLGFITVLPLYVVLIAITKTRTPLLGYFLVLTFLVWIFWWLLKKKQWDSVPLLIVFIAGDYIATGIFAIIGRGGAPEIILTSAVISIWLLALVKRVKRNSQNLVTS